MSPQLFIFYVWDAWMASWVLAGFWSDRAVNWPAVSSQALHWFLFVLGLFLLLGVRAHEHVGPGRLWDVGDALGWTLVAIAAAGFGFCWWARVHIGRLWSGSVTSKADHHIVDTGPYGLVRHPIYTGIIVAAFATGVLRGTIIALLGAGAITLGLWIKARLEEEFLRQELGAETYDSYRRRVPMLAPFGPRSL
jgi:protein-S-isoprenylcysteine O-methyltransferase Ste14